MAGQIVSQFQIGAGFTAAHLSNDPESMLPLPLPVSHMELGLADLRRWSLRNEMPNIDLSLHLARTPVTESRDTQNVFCEHIRQALCNLSPLTSVGIHITGPRNEGIGALGFSSHYHSTPASEDNAVRFIETMRDSLAVPVWIENANFYSASPTEVLVVWESIERICRKTGAGLIVDLSHLLIDARNNGLSPEIVLGAVPWQHLKEIHLSGIIEARDGSLHDGHSCPVYPEVWSLLNHCLNSLIEVDHSTIITIEHTDPTWARQVDLYNADFSTLRSVLLSKLPPKNFASRADIYARNYLKKLLQQWIPKLTTACIQRNISFDTLYEEWLEEVIQHEGRRIVLTEDEVPLIEADYVRVAAKDFLIFSKRRLKDASGY